MKAGLFVSISIILLIASVCFGKILRNARKNQQNRVFSKESEK